MGRGPGWLVAKTYKPQATSYSPFPKRYVLESETIKRHQNLVQVGRARDHCSPLIGHSPQATRV
jgi:hypothetical protein